MRLWSHGVLDVVGSVSAAVLKGRLLRVRDGATLGRAVGKHSAATAGILLLLLVLSSSSCRFVAFGESLGEGIAEPTRPVENSNIE